MERKFHKLVRDKIPEIIENNGEVSITRILDDKEFRKELFLKLKEEVGEVLEAKSSDDVLEELADVYELLVSIAELENHSISDVVEIAHKKKEKRGGFQKRIFLEKTMDKK